jgi:hypothetical protein
MTKCEIGRARNARGEISLPITFRAFVDATPGIAGYCRIQYLTSTDRVKAVFFPIWYCAASCRLLPHVYCKWKTVSANLLWYPILEVKKSVDEIHQQLFGTVS